MKSIISIFLLLCVRLGLAQTPLAPTEAEGLANFTITDPNGVPEENAILTVTSADKKFIKKCTTDIDGKCSMLIPEGTAFRMSVNKFNVDFDFNNALKNMEIRPGAQIKNIALSIELVTNYVRVYPLKHVYFETNRYEISSLKQGSLSDLDNLLDTLNKKTTMKIEIAGHTDNSGDHLSNMHLSQQRADAMRDYLIKKGISPERILSKGYGETSPISSNDTPEGRALNRRTEVRVIVD